MKVFYPDASREDVVRAVQEGVERLAARAALRDVVLFGSYASGRHTVASDVDVLIVYRGEPREDIFGLAKQLIRIPHVEPHVYSEAQASQLADMLARMTRGGIQVYPATDRCSEERPPMRADGDDPITS